MNQLELPFPPEYIEIPLSKTGKHAGKYVAIVSPEDADLAELNWHVVIGTYTQHAIHFFDTHGKRTSKGIHRLIMERILGHPIPDNLWVDHINGNALDNRRKNLRLATASQNNANARKPSNNTSGYKGVMRDYERQSGWKAVITVNGKLIKLGTFPTPEEAHKAYCEAAKKYFGEFANFGE